MQELVQLLTIPFFICLAITGISGYLGIHVLKREIIFIDIALAQIAAVGSIAAVILFKSPHDSVLSQICAFGFTLPAAAFYSVMRRNIFQISLETVIGVSYAIAAAAALFLLALSAEGHSHVEHMLTGSILWAKWSDFLACGIVFSIIGFLFYVFRKRFERISGDYQAAIREEMKVIQWDFLFYSLFGIVITITVRIAGVVVVFSYLIIPATISAIFSSRWRTRLIIAWGSGAVASIMGLLFSYHFDFSVGPSVVAFLGLALIVVSLFKVTVNG